MNAGPAVSVALPGRGTSFSAVELDFRLPLINRTARRLVQSHGYRNQPAPEHLLDRPGRAPPLNPGSRPPLLWILGLAAQHETGREDAS